MFCCWQNTQLLEDTFHGSDFQPFPQDENAAGCIISQLRIDFNQLQWNPLIETKKVSSEMNKLFHSADAVFMNHVYHTSQLRPHWEEVFLERCYNYDVGFFFFSSTHLDANISVSDA